ncbi:GTP-binding protein, partial [Streptomyces yangpuensis]
FFSFPPGCGGGEKPRLTQLVLIGAGTDGEALVRALEACREDAPQDANPESMWGVLRYVDRPRPAAPPEAEAEAEIEAEGVPDPDDRA